MSKYKINVTMASKWYEVEAASEEEAYQKVEFFMADELLTDHIDYKLEEASK